MLLLGALAVATTILYGVQVTQQVRQINASAKDHPGALLVLGGGTLFRVEFDVGSDLTLLGTGGLIVGAAVDLRGRFRREPPVSNKEPDGR